MQQDIDIRRELKASHGKHRLNDYSKSLWRTGMLGVMDRGGSLIDRGGEQLGQIAESDDAHHAADD
jgi:hypothetical protein